MKGLTWEIQTAVCVTFFHYCLSFLADGEMSHAHATLGVANPHLYYSCPEGATVKLICAQSGATMYPKDILKHSWLFTQHSDQHCTSHMGPRNFKYSHGNHTLPAGLQFGSSPKNFWVSLKNVTHADQGRYCCMVLDFHVQDKHATLVQRPHSHVILQVTPRKDTKLITVNGF